MPFFPHPPHARLWLTLANILATGTFNYSHSPRVKFFCVFKENWAPQVSMLIMEGEAAQVSGYAFSLESHQGDAGDLSRVICIQSSWPGTFLWWGPAFRSLGTVSVCTRVETSKRGDMKEGDMSWWALPRTSPAHFKLEERNAALAGFWKRFWFVWTTPALPLLMFLSNRVKKKPREGPVV